MPAARKQTLDNIRGIALVNMLLYHACWDLVYQFGLDWPWYRSFGAYVWQQGICWTFLVLSGYCWSLGRRPLRRGLEVFAAGAGITLATWLFLPENLVYCGVLTLLGAAGMLLVPLAPLLERVPPRAGLAGSFLLFLVLRDVPRGWLGYEGTRIAALPAWLYRNHFTALLGFPPRSFFSTDYVPLLPWFFLVLCGWFLFRLRGEEDGEGRGIPVLSFLGRHSLPVYLVHQPVLYAVFWAAGGLLR